MNLHARRRVCHFNYRCPIDAQFVMTSVALSGCGCASRSVPGTGRYSPCKRCRCRPALRHPPPRACWISVSAWGTYNQAGARRTSGHSFHSRHLLGLACACCFVIASFYYPLWTFSLYIRCIEYHETISRLELFAAHSLTSFFPLYAA